MSKAKNKIISTTKKKKVNCGAGGTFTKSHQTVHLKCVNCIICKLHFNKAICPKVGQIKWGKMCKEDHSVYKKDQNQANIKLNAVKL